MAVEIRVVVDNLLGTSSSSAVRPAMKGSFNLQCSKHVTRADVVDTNVVLRPLNSERRDHMSYSSLRCIVWSLRLRNIDNGARHATDTDNASRRLASHEVLGSLNAEEICAIDVDAPELLHSLIRV